MKQARQFTNDYGWIYDKSGNIKVISAPTKGGKPQKPPTTKTGGFKSKGFRGYK